MQFTQNCFENVLLLINTFNGELSISLPMMYDQCGASRARKYIMLRTDCMYARSSIYYLITIKGLCTQIGQSATLVLAKVHRKCMHHMMMANWLN